MMMPPCGRNAAGCLIAAQHRIVLVDRRYNFTCMLTLSRSEDLGLAAPQAANLSDLAAMWLGQEGDSDSTVGLSVGATATSVSWVAGVYGAWRPGLDRIGGSVGRLCTQRPSSGLWRSIRPWSWAGPGDPGRPRWRPETGYDQPVPMAWSALGLAVLAGSRCRPPFAAWLAREAGALARSSDSAAPNPLRAVGRLGRRRPAAQSPGGWPEATQ